MYMMLVMGLLVMHWFMMGLLVMHWFMMGLLFLHWLILLILLIFLIFRCFIIIKCWMTDPLTSFMSTWWQLVILYNLLFNLWFLHLKLEKTFFYVDL